MPCMLVPRYANTYQVSSITPWNMLFFESPLALWRDVAARLETGLDPASGLLEEFAGFFQLEQIDLAAYTPRTAAMNVLLGRERIQQCQVIKQADVIMLLALLAVGCQRSARCARRR